MIYKANQQATSHFQHVFSTPLRPDVIKRAVLAIQSSRLQPQGRDPMAGKRTSAESRGTGSATARVPRIKGGSGRAAFAPSTVKGRQPHPPRAEKKILKSIPKKEAKLALFSAIAATAQKETVALRGHKIEAVADIPLIVDNAIEGLTKAKEVEEALTKLGVLSDITTSSKQPENPRRQRQAQRQKNEASRRTPHRSG